MPSREQLELRYLSPCPARPLYDSRAAKRGGFKRGFLIWTCPSFFGTFPIFLGVSRFVRGWSGDFPNLSFSSFSAYQEHLRGTVPKGSATQSGPFPKKWETPRFANPRFSFSQMTPFALQSSGNDKRPASRGTKPRKTHVLLCCGAIRKRQMIRD